MGKKAVERRLADNEALATTKHLRDLWRCMPFMGQTNHNGTNTDTWLGMSSYRLLNFREFRFR